MGWSGDSDGFPRGNRNSSHHGSRPTRKISLRAATTAMEVMADARCIHHHRLRRIVDRVDSRFVFRIWYRVALYRTARDRLRALVRRLHRVPIRTSKGPRLLAIADARSAHDHSFADGRACG